MKHPMAPKHQSSFNKSNRTVFTHPADAQNGHEAVTHDIAARRLAALLELHYGGLCDSALPFTQTYLIPRKTMSGAQILKRFVLKDESDLFGGWVPENWMATKAIMHPLVSDQAAAPAGWMAALAQAAIPLTLPGFAAFSLDDALTAARELLHFGSIRLKCANADGGRAQFVARNEKELSQVLASLCTDNLLTDIVVVEENLEEVVTYSVGQVRLPDRVISYFGTQSLTSNNEGTTAYGGSTLFFVRGGFDQLLARELPEETADAVRRAVAFDALADEHIPNFFASRRNYDVACGTAIDGSRRVGVLEQSWRVGGATGAEIAALECFEHDPHVIAVRARTIEAYGDAPAMPSSATLYFHGEDPLVGMLTKYASVEETIES